MGVTSVIKHSSLLSGSLYVLSKASVLHKMTSPVVIPCMGINSSSSAVVTEVELELWLDTAR
jgi:hypothetical protein